MSKVSKVEATYGTSAEIKGMWHKFSFSMEVELATDDDLQEVREKLWNTVQIEVEKQVEELIEG
jgi:hypothetical protein